MSSLLPKKGIDRPSRRIGHPGVDAGDIIVIVTLEQHRCAIVVFALGSIGCGMANSLGALVAARIVQGMGGALMVPVGRLVLLRTVEKSDLVRAMSYVSVPALIGPVMGPPVGGFIVTYWSWPWIFFINIPIGVLGILLVDLLVSDLKDAGRRPFDLAGFALTGVGLASLPFGFENFGRGALPSFLGGPLLARRPA